MRVVTLPRFFTVVMSAALFIGPAAMLHGQDANFHNAPASSKKLKNPYAGDKTAAAAGAKLYATKCITCHGENGKGTGNVPPLVRGPVQSVPDGEIFWFITTGSIDNGMPSWAGLPEKDRWQIVTYVKSLKDATGVTTSAAAPSTTSEPASATVKATATDAPPPQAPFTDCRYEQPGKARKITAQDLPAPYATKSAGNGPKVVARPNDAWPKVPTGFAVQLYASGLDNPRSLRTAPNGDIFLAESDGGNIRVFRGLTADGKPERAAFSQADSTSLMALPSILQARIRSGFMWATQTPLYGFRIRVAI